MSKRTSRKQIETILSSISTDNMEYRLVSHEHLSGSKYTYTYSICCYIDGKHNCDVISSTTLKKLMNVLISFYLMNKISI